MDKVPDYNIIPSLLTPSQSGLIEAGRVFAGAHVCESEQNAILMEMATRHAKYQADHRQQGHQKFQERVEELYKTLGKYAYAEIAAESWERQKDDSMFDLGTEMFTSWGQSSGHWKVAKVKHKYFGADMAMGKDNIWYSCIITGD
jgi:acetyl-CoA carboxylase carboxyltransferase component